MKFENTKVWGFEGALRGMRNPKESWDKSDSDVLFHALQNYSNDDEKAEDYNQYLDEFNCNFKLGPNDLKLAQTLILAGSEHRKFMRQIFVSVDITAPLYWWKEFDTYKVGTVANSTSTMHKMASKPIILDCFEIDDMVSLYDVDAEYNFNIPGSWCQGDDSDNYPLDFINYLEDLRIKYLETKDKRYWKELIRWLPESWLQTRTVTMTYENLLAMCGKGQRRFHKLNEWSGRDNSELTNFISWARTLPYAQEFIFIDEIKKTKTEEEIDALRAQAECFKVLTEALKGMGEDTDSMTCDEILELVMDALRL